MVSVQTYSPEDAERYGRVAKLERDASLWQNFQRHPEQAAYLHSTKRFNVVPAGRRSGKTHCAKLKGARRILHEAAYARRLPVPQPEPWYVFAAPTQQQAKRIWWEQLKRAFPRPLIKKINESIPQTIQLVTGAEITVLGLDAPQRAEGRSLSGIVLDEYGNMKGSVWPQNIRPALSDYLGWADFIGVPEGRNHYYQLWLDALEDDEWGAFTWTSEQILLPSEVESLRGQLDPLTYAQEILAQFVNFAGRAYHQFDDENKKPGETAGYYNMHAGLYVCFDFNVEPGVCAFVQEIDGVTVVIDEIWIERGSNTQRVVEAVLARYGKHAGRVFVYGDASGGSRHSSQTRGSDWDIIKQAFRPAFGDRVRFRIPRANPSVRMRINSVNTRCRNQAGERRLFVVSSCRRVIEDFEGVTVKSNGEIDKPSNAALTHLTDAIGYYIARRFPIVGKGGIINVAA